MKNIKEIGGTRTISVFFGSHDILSNFYDKVKIDYNGFIFNSSEALYQYFKSIFFGDYKTATKIVKCKNAKESKEVSREIKGYSNYKWLPVRERYMRVTLRLKVRDLNQKFMIKI